ncbi:RelA/SpoT domain-containing protein [Pseudomonas sp. TWI923]|uniref:GTP pyrophosphokinase n=1 Tax=Pseudomonas sp. TWI923 TaxID=3136794 RepID=UPI00320B00A5
MNIEQFKDYLLAAQPSLKLWGSFVEKNVKKISKDNGINLQILSSRVKEIDSAIGKLSRKSYANPLKDMTDLVGVRAVCLLSPDVEKLCQAMMLPAWVIQISRDTSKEYEEAPDKFGYQSHHFEIRPKSDLTIAGTTITADTCCELQIRTLMQHAYAEVVHDSIYKSSWKVPSRAVRFVSSSAALIETADHLFCETMNILESESKVRGELLEELTDIYDSKVGISKFKDQKFNMLVLDQLSGVIHQDTPDKIRHLLNERSFIQEKVKARLDSNAFWSQPVSILAYLLAVEHPSSLKELWPYAESEDSLELIYSDLGKKYHNH